MICAEPQAKWYHAAFHTVTAMVSFSCRQNRSLLHEGNRSKRYQAVTATNLRLLCLLHDEFSQFAIIPAMFSLCLILSCPCEIRLAPTIKWDSV